ncbi:hypothetical protein DPMN_026061 [Dreissena polymorpha]|uniref:Redox-regulatory protein FAM213A n=1 Tax=Dreissena polymorpha TaxID=45954 RepID=A0A9D4RD44_DREPO|nr:hypothetical protein DPMN_026061 [Dreissena polymorpha]
MLNVVLGVLNALAAMTASKYFIGAVGAAGMAVLVCNLAPWFVPKAQPATLGYLAAAKLQTLDEKKTNFTASDLWKTNGAVIMAVRRPG